MRWKWVTGRRVAAGYNAINSWHIDACPDAWMALCAPGDWPGVLLCQLPTTERSPEGWQHRAEPDVAAAPRGSGRCRLWRRMGEKGNWISTRDVKTDMKQRLVVILPLLAGLTLVGCTHNSAHGTVAGELVAVGGPAPGGPVPLPGHVVALNSTGDRFAVAVRANGQFRMSLPPGDYRLEGYSPRVRSDGAEMRCLAAKSLHVTSGKYSRGVDVVCSIH